jgi:hypothetical protein
MATRARMKRTIVGVAALLLFSGCQANVGADTVLSGRNIPMTTGTSLDGHFVVVDGCVHVQLQDDGETYSVICPEGSGISAEDSTRATLLNGSVALDRTPEEFKISFAETASLAGEAQRGEIDDWDQCTSDANESVIVLTVVGDILLPQ